MRYLLTTEFRQFNGHGLRRSGLDYNARLSWGVNMTFARVENAHKNARFCAWHITDISS